MAGFAHILLAAAVGATAPMGEPTQPEMAALAKSVGLGDAWNLKAVPNPGPRHWFVIWLGEPQEIAGGMCRLRAVSFDVVRSPHGLSATLEPQTRDARHFWFSNTPCEKSDPDHLFSVDPEIAYYDLPWLVRTSLALIQDGAARGVTVSRIDEDARSLIPTLGVSNLLSVERDRPGKNVIVRFVSQGYFIGFEYTRNQDGTRAVAIVVEGVVDVIATTSQD